MPNQRRSGRISVGGYLDAELKNKIQASGMDKTAFLEWSVVRGLLIRGRITRTEIKKLAEERRIRTTTVLALQNEDLLK
jgi:hypothetical protein